MMLCKALGATRTHQVWLREPSGMIRHVRDPQFDNQVLEITGYFLITFTT